MKWRGHFKNSEKIQNIETLHFFSSEIQSLKENKLINNYKSKKLQK